MQTTLVVHIADSIEDAEDFLEWSGALERADLIPARLVG
jgi:hypothetical protein